MRPAYDCDVLVVGLGPVGAALSLLLADQGLSVIAVEREPQVYPLPRAAHFDHEIMRLFQQLGIAEAVGCQARAAPAYEFRNAAGDVLMRFDLDARPSPSGWPASFMFHQPALETALRDRLAASPLAEVRLGWAFRGFEQDGECVVATIVGPEAERRFRARYLVGCDGASSAVRAACGVPLDDYGFDEPWLVIDARLGPNARPPEMNLQICDPARPTTCVLMGPGRHRWEFMLLPGETAETVSGDDFIANLLRPWNCDDVMLERRAVYRFHGLVAETWRKGRVLLAGDAAHQTPPFAGQGMCSGLRDAANLAWKLGSILRGDADPSLLDTYQLEREPHVRSLIEAAILMGQVVCTLDPAAAAARDAEFIARRQAGARPPPLGDPNLAQGCLLVGSAGAGELFPQPWAVARGDTVKLDDVLGPGAWLIVRGPAPASPGGEALRRFDLDSDPRLAPFREAIDAWLDRRSAKAVLVRPDRYTFGTGAPNELEDAFAAQLGSPASAAVGA